MYQLRSTGAFDLIAQLLQGSLESWDDIWFNFDHILVCNPDWGPQVPGTLLRALPLDTQPLLTVYYHVDYAMGIITLHNVVENI